MGIKKFIIPLLAAAFILSACVNNDKSTNSSNTELSSAISSSETPSISSISSASVPVSSSNPESSQASSNGGHIELPFI